MSKQDKPDRRLISVWQAESLRLTAFPVPAAPVNDPGWWSSLVGEPPEIKATRPREGGRREEGPFERGRLINQVQPNRIDWWLRPSPEREAGEWGLLTLGVFLESLEPFVQLMTRWLELETCPKLQRLAFGAILLLPVDSKVSGYHQVSAYLPTIDLDAECSSDFLYQINRPRKSMSGISGLMVNRLSKWSVAATQLVDIVLAPTPVMYPGKRGELNSCRLELDINTEQGREQLLPQEKLTQVFKELVDLGKEVAEKGDIP